MNKIKSKLNTSKPITYASGKVFIGRMLWYDGPDESPIIAYQLWAYSPLHTSALLNYEKDKDEYRFETLHTIYIVPKKELMKVSYNLDMLKELDGYLQSKEFKTFKKVNNIE